MTYSTGAGRYRILPHTADAGFEATAPELEPLFEAAARAVADLSGEASPGTRGTSTDRVELSGADLPGLAFAWLNELIGLIETRRGVLVDIDVEAVDQSATTGCLLRAQVTTAAYDSAAIRPRHHVKSATFHGLSVERDGNGWKMIAYLDI